MIYKLNILLGSLIYWLSQHESSASFRVSLVTVRWYYILANFTRNKFVWQVRVLAILTSSILICWYFPLLIILSLFHNFNLVSNYWIISCRGCWLSSWRRSRSTTSTRSKAGSCWDGPRSCTSRPWPWPSGPSGRWTFRRPSTTETLEGFTRLESSWGRQHSRSMGSSPLLGHRRAALG